MDVPVERFEHGTRCVLLNGHVVTVDRVSVNEDGRKVVRWRAGQKLRPPHRLAGEYATLGSFLPRGPGETIAVQELL